MGDPFTITEVWAFVTEDPNDGEEGILGASGGGGVVMPMIAADRTRLEILRPEAEKIAANIPQDVKLIRLSHREDIETL